MLGSDPIDRLVLRSVNVLTLAFPFNGLVSCISWFPPDRRLERMAEAARQVAEDIKPMATKRHKNQRFSFCAFLCFLWPFSIAAARAETLTIATYNVANYNIVDRMTEDGFRPQYPKPEAEKAALRRVIRDLDADVLALQEMGDAPFLRELQRDLRSEGCEYPHATVFEFGEEPRHVAVLSRRPFTAERRHADLEFKYFDGREPVRRGLLEVRVATAAGELTLFVVHLKSRYTDRADDPMSAVRRTAEATAVRDRILEVFPSPASARFLILGDFNAAPRDRPVQAMLMRGQREISELLPATDSRGEAWTHAYRRDDSYSRVDHVLVSPALRTAVVGRAARIHDGPGVREASDHRPVVVTLLLE
jgi:endonuclease/exonuclease/phosphatase family metal-dependent hydrolase